MKNAKYQQPQTVVVQIETSFNLMLLDSGSAPESSAPLEID